MEKQMINEAKRMQQLAGVVNEIFGTSEEKENEKLEDTLDRWIKYHMESGKDEQTIKQLASDFIQDSIDVYLGGKIDNDELENAWDDVSSKL